MEDLVARPLEVVERCCLGLEQAPSGAAEGQGRGGGSHVHARVTGAFRALLREQGPSGLARIPLLNPATWLLDRASGKLPPDTLVRFRGMVQDMLDPQFFVGMQKHKGTGQLRCALYSDGAAALEEESAGQGAEGWEPYKTMERRPLILTPIPGEAPWVLGGLVERGAGVSSSSSSSSGSSNKRGLGQEDAMEVEVGGEEEAPRGAKAARTGDAGTSMAVDGAVAAAAVPAAAGVPVPAAAAAEAGAGLRCLSYLYGEEEDGDGEGEEGTSSGSMAPRLNEAVDVLAVLCYTPPGLPAPRQQQPAAAGGSTGMAEQDEEEAVMEQLLLGLEPRLHIILWTKAQPLPLGPGAALHDPTPFLGPLPTPAPTPTPNSTNIKVRAALLAHLTAALGGDALSAEYLLLALLARVRLRSPAGEVVGPLPLNLSRAPAGLAQRVAALVESLCPRSRLLKVDLPTLDDPTSFIPRKDPAKLNVLETTPLQVCPGTALVLDETGLDSGRLGPEGVANLRCLKGLIEKQTLPCHFGFYQLDFHTDCPVLVISKSRSILGGGALCQVPYTPTNTNTSSEEAPTPTIPPARATIPALSDEALGAFRTYLAAGAAKAVEIDAAIAERAEREFVGLRGTEEGKKTLTPEALGRWLTLCRLLCASEEGDRLKVGDGHWERMRALEEERVGRLRALGLDPPAQ